RARMGTASRRPTAPTTCAPTSRRRASESTTGRRMAELSCCGCRSTRSVDAAQCAGWGRPRTSVPIRPTARCGSAARAFPSGTVNSPAGLEQGFTVERRPKGEGPLILEIAVGRARSTLSGDAVVFDTGVRKLSYGALAAVDDGGVPRPAYFALASA